MTEELKHIQDSIFHILGLPIIDLTEDGECKGYDGYNFQIGTFKIKFRKAKVTPKKIGQFVTLWRRNAAKQTEPFHINDDLDFYLIATRDNERFGFFFFPKHVLGKNFILTDSNKIGKRGFRVYPDWDIPISKQAQTAKAWQTAYFIDLTKNSSTAIEKFNLLVFRKTSAKPSGQSDDSI